MTLRVGLFVCKTWYVTIQQHKLIEFDNKVLRNVLVPEEIKQVYRTY
jgi:hypothetical protein